MCPFCYIGKRKFEQALQRFDGRENVAIGWHSFQLDPNMKSQPGKDVHTYLAEIKGQSREWSLQMHEQVTNTAKAVGLTYNFNIAVIANSFDAHRLIQLAKKHGKGDAAEERLFSAYFTEGKDTSDHATLIELAVEIGLNKEEVITMLAGAAYSNEVKADINEAAEIGVRGVPFFVFDRKYAISGAQSPDVFVQVLEKSFGEWREKHPVLQMEEAEDGNFCTTDGGSCN